MNIRAWIPHDHNFYYPSSDSPEDLIEFWSVLEGYRRKGKPYNVSYGSGVEDIYGKEIFQDDVVQMTVQGLNGGVLIETGSIDFEDGAFIAYDHTHTMYYPLMDFIPPEGKPGLKVIGHKYLGTTPAAIEDEDDELAI